VSDQAQRTNQACEITDPLAEELEPLLREGVDYHCLFLCGVVCGVRLELILNEVVEMGSVRSINKGTFYFEKQKRLLIIINR